MQHFSYLLAPRKVEVLGPSSGRPQSCEPPYKTLGEKQRETLPFDRNRFSMMLYNISYLLAHHKLKRSDHHQAVREHVNRRTRYKGNNKKRYGKRQKEIMRLCDDCTCLHSDKGNSRTIIRSSASTWKRRSLSRNPRTMYIPDGWSARLRMSSSSCLASTHCRSTKFQILTV